MHKILLIISGSIAAYKALELIRRGRDRGYQFTTILTKGGAEFVTPLACASLSGTPCYTDLFSLKDETEMGHIRLSRESDAVLIVPASADLLAKMATGRADDLASTVLLATDKPIIAAPGMNSKMWGHPATQRNLNQVIADGVQIIQPGAGVLACGEVGTGRMAEVAEILDYLDRHTSSFLRKQESDGDSGLRRNDMLRGKRALVTAGPTHEPLDPVRYIANRSSGKQGYAIAAALADAGAEVTLVSGATALPCPPGVKRIDVQTAEDMWAACESALPADIAICTAAVVDWRPAEMHPQKMKKTGKNPTISLVENPDILASLAQHPTRPKLLIGFAAETENLEENARAKLARKGCDWIVANDVSQNVFGADENEVILFTKTESLAFGKANKQAIAELLVDKVVAILE